MAEQVMQTEKGMTAFWLALCGQKEEAAPKNCAEPTISQQIQAASDALEMARQQFDAETDFDRIDSHIFMMQAMENRLNSLFIQAKKEHPQKRDEQELCG